MSSKSQLDLLVRVRYSNPLPPPPYPPKLLNIPTDPKRYARSEFTQQLSNDTPLPMVVDAECGMPLDLSHFDSLWDGSNGVSDGLDGENPPPIDPRDLFMLEGLQSNAGGPSAVNVGWLRKTAYLSGGGDGHAKHGGFSTTESKADLDVPIDMSLPAQIISIEATFPSTDRATDLSNLKHPSKPGLTAVEAYDFLPDTDVWANTYDIFKFSERPGERPLDVPDPRLDCGILRPQEIDGEHFLSYYLTKEDEEADEYKMRRRLDDPNQEDKPPIAFHWVRDYETSKVDQDITNEVLMVLDDLDDDTPGARRSTHETKGAYYMTIQRKIMLKKKRANKWDAPMQDKIDILQISHQPFTAEDEAERLEASSVITDPAWIAKAQQAQEAANAEADMFGGGADAEGEIDEELPVNGHHRSNGDMEL